MKNHYQMQLLSKFPPDLINLAYIYHYRSKLLHRGVSLSFGIAHCCQIYVTIFCSRKAETLVDTQLAMVHSSQREQKPSSCLRLFLC